MPKNNMDYSKCVIYRIVCKDLNIKECYVGHTTNLIKRKCHHKSSCNENSNRCNLKVYQFIRANGGFDNWDIIKIEDYPCKDILEATKQERYWKEYYNANLNSCIPSRTHKEYYIENKNIVYEKQKIYNEGRKDILKNYKKTYYEKNKEEIKEKSKKYRLENADKEKERSKKYYIEKKDKIKEKIVCECGCEITKRCLTHHKTTLKHQTYLQSLEKKL